MCIVAAVPALFLESLRENSAGKLTCYFRVGFSTEKKRMLIDNTGSHGWAYLFFVKERPTSGFII